MISPRFRFSLALLACLVPLLGLRAQTFPTSNTTTVTKSTATSNLTGSFNTGTETITVSSGGTLTVSGTFGGTPTGGTLSLANLSLTLPASQPLTTPNIGAATGTSLVLTGNLTNGGATASTLAYFNASKVASSVTLGPKLGLSSGTLSVTTSDSPRGGINSTGATYIGLTRDNTGLAFGTGDFSIGAWARFADSTPAAEQRIAGKGTGLAGWSLALLPAGTLQARIGNGAGETTFTSTVATGVADNAWAFYAATFDRDGNLVFYVNGSQLGAAVSIASLSAQTATNTAALYWGANSGTAQFIVGTLGETFIVNGLLTATQVSDIYKAGSIAPFAASFTFYQWADFSQGYGPIVKDRSGQNQPALMGASGLTHAVPRNPPGIPQRAPRTALALDGSTNTTVRATLGTQNPATGDLTLWWDGVFSSRTTNHGMAILTSAADSSPAGAVAVGLSSTALDFFMRGATTSDYTRLRLLGWQALAAGKRGVVALTRSGTTVKIFVGLDGDFVEVTNLTTTDSGGAGAVWSASIPGTYFGVGYSAGGEVFDSLTYDARLANVAMTEAQLRTEYERGEPGPEWGGATRTAKYTSDFSAGLSGWTADGVTATGNKDAIFGQDDVLELYANATAGNHRIYQGFVFSSAASRARVSFSYYIPAANTTVDKFVVLFTGGATNFIAPTYDAWTTINLDLPVMSTGGVLQIQQATTVSSSFTGAGSASDDLLYIKGITVEQIGYTARLRTDTAAGLTALNSAKSSTNDSTDFLLSTTGVTTSPDARTQTIRFSTSTNGNQQLGGASVIDTTKKWRINSWTINSAGTPTVSLGNVSAGTQYDNAIVLVSGINDITLDDRTPDTANLWCNSSTTDVLQHTVVLHAVD